MTPAAVAELVANGIETDRFWLLPHPDRMPMAVERWDRIRAGEPGLTRGVTPHE